MATDQDIADVLVIGGGASGAAFTWSLTQAGIKVVCLEQGGWVPQDAFPTSEPDAQIHWQTDFHPSPNVRGLPEDYPLNESETPISPLMFNAVGGSTIHWGSHIPRFHPSDFRLKTMDGVSDDWPLSYAELEPYYDQKRPDNRRFRVARRPSISSQGGAALPSFVYSPRRGVTGQGVRKARLALVVVRHRSFVRPV